MSYSKKKRKEIIDKLSQGMIKYFSCLVSEYNKNNVVLGYKRPNSKYINPIMLSTHSWEFHDTSNCGYEFGSIPNIGIIVDSKNDMVDIPYDNINIIELKDEIKFLENIVFTKSINFSRIDY